mmetsp:Transcript_21637/g.61632  ORF Transcript_21637/g.61632 Transcript_21637/m.61632 type:complete len:187 (+) Transcript_21637:1181-1741(+)
MHTHLDLRQAPQSVAGALSSSTPCYSPKLCACRAAPRKLPDTMALLPTVQLTCDLSTTCDTYKGRQSRGAKPFVLELATFLAPAHLCTIGTAPTSRTGALPWLHQRAAAQSVRHDCAVCGEDGDSLAQQACSAVLASSSLAKTTPQCQGKSADLSCSQDDSAPGGADEASTRRSSAMPMQCSGSMS